MGSAITGFMARSPFSVIGYDNPSFLSSLLSEFLERSKFYIGNPNARSPTQANLMQVSESTEIIYDKNVVNFSGNDEQCVRSTQKVCTKYPFIHLLLYLLAGHGLAYHRP